MRERSHKKGEVYQQDIKNWLIRSRFLDFDLELFGDAYDVSKKACTIGGVVFDFSLKLYRGNVTRYILYGECKYRDEQRGNVNKDFKEFLRRAYRAMSAAEPDDADSALFIFFSTLPPDGWRQYLKNRQKYYREELAWGASESPEEQVLVKLARAVHVLVLSARIVARE